MGTSLVTARPTTSLRPSWRSIDCSPEVLVSLNTGPKLIARFGERERPQHRLSLGFSLREFVCGIGIGDDAGAGLHDDAILEHERRADRNRRIETRRTPDRKSTRLNSSHSQISYAVFCLKKKNEPARTRSRPRSTKARVEGQK